MAVWYVILHAECECGYDYVFAFAVRTAASAYVWVIDFVEAYVYVSYEYKTMQTFLSYKRQIFSSIIRQA